MKPICRFIDGANIFTKISKYKLLSIPLNHSSIVAREYGIPVVMAARNATCHIKSGQIITVNGTEGTIIIENHR